MPETDLPPGATGAGDTPSTSSDAVTAPKKSKKEIAKERRHRNTVVGLAVLVGALVLLALGYLLVFPKTELYDSREGLAVRVFFNDAAAKKALEEGLLSGEAREMQKDADPWLKVEKEGARFLADLKAQNIAQAGIAAQVVLVSTKDGGRYYVVDNRGLYGSALVKALEDNPSAIGQVVSLNKLTIPEGGFKFGPDVLLPLYMVVMVAFLATMFQREFRVGGARQFMTTDVRFADVIGCDEAKTALSDVVSYLKAPEAFTRLGGRAPKGVMMLGGPGVGKTLLAKAMAGEAGVKFLAISGSDFSSKYYGAGIAKVRSLFAQARKNAPCIVFIDEADGLGKRNQGGSSESTEHNRILNQFLIEMDGFASNEGVVFIGATNLIQNIDEAILREGRFDRRIEVGLPDRATRAELFRFYGKKVVLAEGIDHDKLSRFTSGMSPATIEFVLATAATSAAKKDKSVVEEADLFEAIETARMGALNGSEKAMPEELRKRIAVHEVGHAILAAVNGVGVLEKVTILPRGGALGVTLVTPPEDVKLMTYSQLRARISMLLGGRGAELLSLGEASSGASHDLKEATKLALAMAGTMALGQGHSLISTDALPTELAQAYMPEVIARAERILKVEDAEVHATLLANRQALDTLVHELLEQQTIDGTRVLEVLSQHANVGFQQALPGQPELKAA